MKADFFSMVFVWRLGKCGLRGGGPGKLLEHAGESSEPSAAGVVALNCLLSLATLFSQSDRDQMSTLQYLSVEETSTRLGGREGRNHATSGPFEFGSPNASGLLCPLLTKKKETKKQEKDEAKKHQKENEKQQK